jgi:glycosyltransferase involved in cell wall biosynthesis
VLTGKTYSYDHDPILARMYGRHFSRKLAREKPDLVYAPAGSSCVAYLKTDAPIVYYSDATWRVVHGYQPSFSNLLKFSERSGEELEKRTLGKCEVALFSSSWAAGSAVQDYATPAERVHTVFIGANLLAPPARAEVLPRRLGERVRLLFIGTIWELKGGAIALAALERLLEMGFDAELTVIGCSPPAGVDHPRMKLMGFLNKQDPTEEALFRQIWSESDLFILPTRCEAAGIVFCEASAYAVPIFATDTGGVSSLVADGENGYTLPMEADGADWAERIAELLRDPERYAELCESSREVYESRLNWDVWGKRVAAIVAEAAPHLEHRIARWQAANAEGAGDPARRGPAAVARGSDT